MRRRILELAAYHCIRAGVATSCFEIYYFVVAVCRPEAIETKVSPDSTAMRKVAIRPTTPVLPIEKLAGPVPGARNLRQS